MAWNDQQPPWGTGGRPPSPEELIAILFKKIKDRFFGGGGFGGGPTPKAASEKPDRRGVLAKVVLMVVALFAFNVVYSSFYSIRPGEKGVVLRFGAYTKTTEPGLNFKIPLIDTVRKVDVETVRKEEFGFRTKVPGQVSTFEKKGFEPESLMLTGDKNVIDVEWIVQYKVRDPVNFLFQVQNVQQAVRDVSEMAIRRIMGNMDFDYVLSNRELLAGATGRELQVVLNQFKAGVEIVTVQLQDVNPPDAVKPAFNEVNEADQDMKRLVNEAEEAYNKEIPKARGTAKRVLEEARGYAIERINDAKGEASRFSAILQEYRSAKDVTRKRMYLETMREVLPSVKDIIIVDEQTKGILPFLDLTDKKTAN